MSTPTPIEPDDLPTTVRAFLAAHHVRDTDVALATFTPAAVVVDDGTTYRGTGEIRGFLTRAGAEFSYTTELVAAQRVDADHWVVTHRLVGDFPGGVATLAYRFALDGGLVTELVIGP